MISLTSGSSIAFIPPFLYAVKISFAFILALLYSSVPDINQQQLN